MVDAYVNAQRTFQVFNRAVGHSGYAYVSTRLTSDHAVVPAQYICFDSDTGEGDIHSVWITHMSIVNASNTGDSPVLVSVDRMPRSISTSDGRTGIVMIPPRTSKWGMDECYVSDMPRAFVRKHGEMNSEYLWQEYVLSPHDGTLAEEDIVFVRGDTMFQFMCSTDAEYIDPGTSAAVAASGIGCVAFHRSTVARVIQRIEDMNNASMMDLAQMRFVIEGAVGTEVCFEARFHYITAGPFVDLPVHHHAHTRGGGVDVEMGAVSPARILVPDASLNGGKDD